jgi:hypothetical protein
MDCALTLVKATLLRHQIVDVFSRADVGFRFFCFVKMAG